MAYNHPSSPVWSRSPARLRLVLFLSVSTLMIFLLILYSPQPPSCYSNSDTVVCRVAHKAKDHLRFKSHDKEHTQDLTGVKSKFAFATFLAGREDATIDDPYFIAVRMLTYQLLHANETRSHDRSIPFVVLCTDKVPQEQKSRLQRDGAIVVVGESIQSDWAKTDVGKWQDVLTKLRIWEFTQFELVALLDGDTVLTQPLDGVFNDPAVYHRDSLIAKTNDIDPVIKPDEQPLPATYSFAGVPEMKPEHGYPPTEENHDFPNLNYLNAGFFVFKPDVDMLGYYLSLLDIPGRFSPDFPEQNLLNYAHRREGAMPWLQLDLSWNIHMPKLEDVQGGVKSIHDKWWQPGDKRLAPMMESWRWRMEGYFESRDAVNGGV
ncbi:unnamed protein product [Periconia digitata]|uniref:Nucleotide-diphospho-sugar transferase n=1 Tax=Periconia digitata TaxID=1303443 RepID=A0A9W4U9X7_9PLEO|nr:unnamed protein product [Periconia digitata]